MEKERARFFKLSSVIRTVSFKHIILYDFELTKCGALKEKKRAENIYRNTSRNRIYMNVCFKWTLRTIIIYSSIVLFVWEHQLRSKVCLSVTCCDVCQCVVCQLCNDYVITRYFSVHAQLYSVWPLSSCYGWFPINMLSSNTSLNP